MRASAREHAPFSPGTSSCCVACGIIWRRLYGGEWEVEGDVPPEKNPEWVTKSKDGLNSDSELCADSRGSLLIPPSPLPPDWPFMFGFGFPDSFLASVSGLHLFRGSHCNCPLELVPMLFPLQVLVAAFHPGCCVTPPAPAHAHAGSKMIHTCPLGTCLPVCVCVCVNLPVRSRDPCSYNASYKPQNF